MRMCGIGERVLDPAFGGQMGNPIGSRYTHQLIDLKRNDETVFDSIIVVTDRRILDQQK